MKPTPLSKYPKLRERSEQMVNDNTHWLIEYDYPNGTVQVEVWERKTPGLYTPLWGKEIPECK